MTFGLAPFGLSPFGGVASSISISRAWATSTRTVRVTTSSPAKADSPFDAGDALNPGTWLVGQLAGDDYTPIGVRHLGGLVAFEVTVLELFGSAGVAHRIASSTLRGAGGPLITAPYQAIFDGVDDVINPLAGARQRPRIRDLANPFRGNPQTGDTMSAIQMQAGGFRAEVDAAVTYKGILRRLTTERGSHRDLPDYGVGYQSKALIPFGGDLVALTVEVERQCRREPGVKNIKATLTVPGGGILVTRIAASIVGAQLSFAIRRNTDGSFAKV